MHVYMHEMNTALKLTQKLFHGTPTLTQQNGKLITNEALIFIRDSVGEISGRKIDRIAGECLNIHVHLADRLRKKFGWTVYLTLGSVEVLGKKWASFDAATAETFFGTRPKKGERFLGHGWLTLPSLEIIDATIQTTLAKQSDNNTLVGDIIAQDIATVGAIQYHPTVLGERYVQSVFGIRQKLWKRIINSFCRIIPVRNLPLKGRL